MRLVPKEPPRERPESGWTDAQVQNAEGIILNTPDVNRRTFALRRLVQLAVFLAFIAITWVVAEIHLALIVPVWLVGMFLVGTEYLQGYGKSRRELAWAKSVIAERGTYKTRGDVSEP